MPSLRKGTCRKGIYHVDNLCAIQILLGRDSGLPPGEETYKPGRFIAKGALICHFICWGFQGKSGHCFEGNKWLS
jgi:hypothetical protein